MTLLSILNLIINEIETLLPFVILIIYLLTLTLKISSPILIFFQVINILAVL